MDGDCRNGCGGLAHVLSPVAGLCRDCGDAEQRMRERAALPKRVPCPGCVKRGVPKPQTVKRGYQCDACADLEEGAA